MASPQPAINQYPERRDFRKDVTESIIRMLEQGVAPWQKPWDAATVGNLSVPFNPTSNNPYRGGNAVYLMATALRKGYEDPRWMTYKQASANGWQVRGGEKGTQIEFWELRKTPQADGKTLAAGDASDREDAAGHSQRKFIHRVYTVFNAKQIDRIPPQEPKLRSAFAAVETGEKILSHSGARIEHDQADRAFYSRASDSIHLPARESFRDAPGYYGTALHELAHWSGHPDRLNRQTLNQSYRFGDQNYAREELRAELASLFLAAERGIPNNPAHHASYVGAWIQALRDDKNEIFRAAQDASRATEFLLSLERDKSMAQALVDSPETAGDTLEQESAQLQSDLESAPAAMHESAQADGQAMAVGLGAADELARRQLGNNARTSMAVVDGGIYRGVVIGATDEFVIQQISKSAAVAHPKELLDTEPRTGQRLAITYRDSHAFVREVQERGKAQELAR